MNIFGFQHFEDLNAIDSLLKDEAKKGMECMSLVKEFLQSILDLFNK